MTSPTSKEAINNVEDKVLTTAVGNAELYADTTDPKKLQALSEKNNQQSAK